MALKAAGQLGTRILHETFGLSFLPLVNRQSQRFRHTKHWNPKWKSLRGRKVVKVKLPDFQEKTEDLSVDQIRSKLKENGILPPRPWNETQFHISSTGATFEAYVPPEGDGKVSPITAQGAKQKLQFLEKKSKTMMAIRKIRSFEDEFDTPEFCKKAEEIYKKAHNCLVTKDKDKLTDFVTERAYPEMLHNMENKTIHWKLIKNVELPRVVHARCTNLITKENIFAQITVRFHTQQQLAIYDRFGRLMHGSEILAKDVLEYVVFEKHLANEYGIWRLHDKIIPDWIPMTEPIARTVKLEKEVPEVAETIEVVAETKTVENKDSNV